MKIGLQIFVGDLSSDYIRLIYQMLRLNAKTVKELGKWETLNDAVDDARYHAIAYMLMYSGNFKKRKLSVNIIIHAQRVRYPYH